MVDKSKKIVSVIVVTRGLKDYFRLCLDSLRLLDPPSPEIIVIDNSADQKVTRECEEKYAFVRFYAGGEQLSYCDSLNRGIDLSNGDFVLCLNDDVVLDKRFVSEALSGFYLHNKIGSVSGKVLRMDGKTIDTTGLFLSCFRSVRERGYGLKDKGQFKSPGYIFGVNGAVAFYRREMLNEIKEGKDYFDSSFHFFYEDLDIAWRAQRSRWAAYYVPGAIAYHARGGSVRAGRGTDKPWARRYLDDDLHLDLIKNRYLTILKNESLFTALIYLPCILLYDFFQWGYVLIFRPRIIKMFLSSLHYFACAWKKKLGMKIGN